MDSPSEYLLTIAGSKEAIGTYTRSSEDDIIWSKRRTTSDLQGVVFIITLESLPEKGEDFEVAWVIQSHNAVSEEVVTFYAVPCDDPESLTIPAKGWTVISGLEPAPRLYARPKHPPKIRASNLDIIEEDKEREFSLEPYWAPEGDHLSEEERGNDFDFTDWDEIRENLAEEYEGEIGEIEDHSSDGDSDYEEVELPDDLMENFRDGHFGHKPKPDLETSFSSEQEMYPRGSTVEDSDTSDDPCIIRHDVSDYMFEHSETSEGKASISSPGDFDDKVEEHQDSQATSNTKASSPPEREVYTVVNSTVNPQLAYTRSIGKITVVDKRRMMVPKISGKRYGCQILRYGAPEMRPLIEPIKDPFSPYIQTHMRSRNKQDQIDGSLIPVAKETIQNESQPRKSGGSEGFTKNINNSDLQNSGKFDRMRRRRRNPQPNVEIPANLGEAMREDENVDSKMSQTISKKDQERLELEKELHKLKTKMRKCDRISKLRNRGRNLSKEQQEILVSKSKHQHRIEQLRRLLGSDIGRL